MPMAITVYQSNGPSIVPVSTGAQGFGVPLPCYSLVVSRQPLRAARFPIFRPDRPTARTPMLAIATEHALPGIACHAQAFAALRRGFDIPPPSIALQTLRTPTGTFPRAGNEARLPWFPIYVIFC